MKPYLDDTWGASSTSWIMVPDELDTSDELLVEEWVDDNDGRIGRIGIDDTDLTLDQAMFIAEQYGGGEFDNECAGIVAALCVLRDHIKAADGGES